VNQIASSIDATLMLVSQYDLVFFGLDIVNAPVCNAVLYALFKKVAVATSCFFLKAGEN